MPLESIRDVAALNNSGWVEAADAARGDDDGRAGGVRVQVVHGRLLAFVGVGRDMVAHRPAGGTWHAPTQGPALPVLQ